MTLSCGIKIKCFDRNSKMFTSNGKCHYESLIRQENAIVKFNFSGSRWGHGGWCKPSCIPITVILTLIVLVVLLPLLEHNNDKNSLNAKGNSTPYVCSDMCRLVFLILYTHFQMKICQYLSEMLFKVLFIWPF